MSIAGDLTGGWPSKNEETGEWDWSVAKPMVQDSEDPDLWTLTIQGVNVEAKKYEYKAFANSSYFGYQLPAEGNADFVFGTKNYPAGTYTLIFTANVGEHKHWLKLEAVNENPEATDINFDVAGGDIAQALEQAKTGVSKVGNITINLTKGVEYTISNTLEAPASITINGNDAIIDASELTAPMVSMANVEEPTEWTEANVRIAGLKIKGLKQALFFSTCKNYLIKDFTVDWVNVEVAADATVFDFTKGSVALNFNVTNSTFYAPTATTKSFYSSQSGQKATEADGEAIQTFKFANNTMYNLAKSKNFFSHRQSNQSWLAYDVQGNIFVNCGKSGQTIKGMNGGQGGKNPTWTIKGNAFNFEGTDTSASESTGDDDEAVEESVAGVVTFVNADEGNFNGEFALSEGVAPQTLGAPMWTITFKAAPAPYYLSGNFNDWGVDDLYRLELNTKADEGIEEYMITVQLAADAQFKVVKAEDPKGAAEDWVWYPAGTGNAYGENGELAAAGTYIVYFRPNRDGGDDWFHGYIYVFNPATDGINTIAAEAQKGNVYNMQGIRVAQPTKGLYIINGHKVVIK
jgi:hypothetical protein